MNSQIATRPATNGRITAKTETDALIATLPKWLAYLVGAFPAAQTNKMTFLAYETAFADVDPGLMLKAAQLAAKDHRFNTFPLIGELHSALCSVESEGEDYETAVANRPRVNLILQRARLLEDAYHGEFDQDAWLTLYRQLVAHKRIEAAHGLAVKFERLAQRPLVASNGA